MKPTLRLIILFQIVFALLTFTQTFAQALTAMQVRERAIGIEWVKPGLRGNSNAGTLASSLFLSISQPLQAFNIVAEIPFAYVSNAPNLNPNNIMENNEGTPYVGRDFGYSDSSGGATTIGNIFLGINTRKQQNATYVETGLRIPFATLFEDGKGQATALGIFSDFVERVEAFAPEYLSAIVMVHKHKSQEGKFSYHGEGGLSILLPIRDVEINPELYLRYGFQVVQDKKDFSVEAGLKGRILMSRNPDFFQDQTVHQFSARANFKRGKFIPGLYFSRPFDNNLKNVINWTFGASLTVKA
ncbi:MAG: hypothetical protein ACRBF0_04175 [Calditrichia bacterium]